MNLREETIDQLNQNKKTGLDVRWVGTREWRISWESFKEVSDFEYDDGFGGAEVNQALLVVGDDWWLERHEYDGSEWWEFKVLPKMPDKVREAAESLLKER